MQYNFISLLGLRTWSESRLPPPITEVSPVVLPFGSCNEYLTGINGSFSPPDSCYKNNTECVWIIEVPRGYGIRITFFEIS